MNKTSDKEDICNRCGKCCHFKIRIGSISVFSRKHCEFLDEETNLCIVYKDRFKKKPGCLTIEEAIDIKAVPNDCPYVKDIQGYDGPKDIDNF